MADPAIRPVSLGREGKRSVDVRIMMPNTSFAQGGPSGMKIDMFTRLLPAIFPFEMVKVIELSPGGDDTPATCGVPDAFTGDINLTLGAVALERKKPFGKLIVILP